jgi:hypothetical protein
VTLSYGILTPFVSYSCILYPPDREKMQPSLVLSVLALSSLMQSIGGRGAIPRDRAEVILVHSLLIFLSHYLFQHLECAARGALQASINAGWFDLNLAQAAMVCSN